MLGSAIGAIARKIGTEVSKGLGKKTAEKVTRKAGVTLPRGEKPFKKKLAEGSTATISRSKGKPKSVKNASAVSGKKPAISEQKAAASTAALAKARASELAKNTKVIAARRGKDITGTGAVAGTAGYVAGKKKKKK